MQSALGLFPGHELVRRGAGDPLELRAEGDRFVDQRRRGVQIFILVAHVLSRQALVIFRGIEVIVDHPLHHTGFGLAHLRGEAAHHAEVYDQLHLVAVDEQLRRRGRGDLPRAGAQHIELVCAHVILVHLEAMAVLHGLCRAVTAQHRIHLHRHQHPDLFHIQSPSL